MKIRYSIEVTGLGRRIRDARRLDTRSLHTLCELAGISRYHWYRIEKEQVEELTAETLRKIESALGVDFGVSFPGGE